MESTTHLALPVMAAAQSQKHVTHNEALWLLDALVQLSVLDRDRTVPPAEPQPGDRHIVAASAGGAWAGHAREIALWEEGRWRFLPPRAGFIAFVRAEGALVVHDGVAWTPVLSGASFQNLPSLGIGTAADATNPLAAKLNAALLTARSVPEGGTGHLRLTLNK
jgi:hypothetical protein